MSRKIAVLMDPIEKVKVEKDTSLAMMLAAQSRGWELTYIQRKNLFMRDGKPAARAQAVKVFDNKDHWYEAQSESDVFLEEFDCILMRLDPPFNMDYVYATYYLQKAADAGTLVLNNPAALRDINEKMFTAWFPDCCQATRWHGRLINFSSA